MTERECQNVFALLSQHLDGELPAETCEELERHIQDCGPCVEFVESLKKTVALGRRYEPGVDTPQPTPEVKEALRKAYAQAMKK
jgi:anti-sigma factor RsiW